MDPIQRLSPKELIFNIRRQRLWEKNLIAQKNFYSAKICKSVIKQLWGQLRIQEGKR